MAIVVVFLILGLFLVVSSLMGWDWIYGFWDVELTHAILGESAARLLCGGSGLAVMGMSIVFAMR